MFGNKTHLDYNGQNATLEILIMLLGAFVLGYLICWVLDRYKQKHNSNNKKDSFWSSLAEEKGLNTHSTSNSVIEGSNITTTKSRVTEEVAQQPLTTKKHDDFTKISGMTTTLEKTLHKNDIYTYAKLKNTSKDQLKEIFIKENSKRKNKSFYESWPQEANLAEKEDWGQLANFQKFLKNYKFSDDKQNTNRKKTTTTSKAPVAKTNKSKDDLKKIVGIGPKIEALLKKAKITNYEKLSKTNISSLESILDKAGPQFQSHNPKTWPKQAKFAALGDWRKFEEYKDYILASNKKIT